ncbi:RNA polymerase sigma factor [Agaribacter flavus]|uniref:RNA polymerase sigma factor n=1 Tax=Agaribacter flavus TaxID=1902781 RepID=A0ABV7FS48_9ALTE
MSRKTNIHLAKDISDLALVQASLSGDKIAYSALLTRHEVAVRAFLRVRLNDPYEAEDLAQETFILAYNKLEMFRESASFGAWLRGIATNLLRNHQRKNSAITVGGNHELENLVNQQIEGDFDAERESTMMTNLKVCVEQLDEKLKVLVTEHFTLGYSLSELCKKYDDRHSTMTMRMYRIRQKLKRCVERKMESSDERSPLRFSTSKK